MAHEHLKERGLFGLPAPGTNPSDYYHQMTLMAGHPAPYGDLLMQSGSAASAPHLHDYLNPVDGECMGGHGGAGGRARQDRGASQRPLDAAEGSPLPPSGVEHHPDARHTAAHGTLRRQGRVWRQAWCTMTARHTQLCGT